MPRIKPNDLVRIGKFSEYTQKNIQPGWHDFPESWTAKVDYKLQYRAPVDYRLDPEAVYLVLDVFTQQTQRSWWRPPAGATAEAVYRETYYISPYGHERLILLTPHGPGHIATFYMERVDV